MPGTRCAVYGCNNTYIKQKEIAEKFSCHRFPKARDLVSQTIRKEWTVRCKREDEDKLNPDTSYICSVHFTENDYERDLQNEVSFIPNIGFIVVFLYQFLPQILFLNLLILI
jgi:hypothetical protein